jgi:hypothetical protein
MTYNPNIPQGPDRFPASQPQILNNFGFLDTYFDVDHFKWSAASHNGEHRKISLNFLSPSPGAQAGADIIFSGDSTEAGGFVPSLAPYYTAPTGNLYSMQGCAAWVRFNGTNAAVSDSFNIASVTRNGAGDYTIGFSQPFANGLYAAMGSCQVTNVSGRALQVDLNDATTFLPGSCKIRIAASNGNGQIYLDSPLICVSFFGRLAP